MKTEDVIAIGRLVLIAVIVGAVLATAGPPTAQALAKMVARYLGM